MTEFSNIVIEIIILLLCASLSFAILKIIAAVTEKIQTSSKFLNIDVAIITIAILLFVSAFLMSGSSPKANRTNEKENVFITNTNLKILLIGLDGATWHIADNLLKEGKLPNIEKIISNGSKGDLRSYISPINPFKNTAGGGMFSSALWTSIATGKTPRENGVQDLIMVSLPGMKHPLPFRFPFTYNIFKLNTPKSYHIRTNRIWNILSHYGKFCEVYGWWCTWPVERVNGIMVSMAADNPLKRIQPSIQMF
ncbi:MAG: hypothetical protein D6734_05960 [Candidatus Schekmanbacteria bacterium]|nr:MAG: hypothetical protein D6734_05960 [Candidatus Schekmanbacteria bacterium]